jgi:hypothetical protein
VTRATQNMLYHLLPAVFWLLAIGGALVPLLPVSHLPFSISRYCSGFLIALVVLICIRIVSRIQRHTDSIEECFQVALLLGIASYWLPSVLFLILPVWGYLIYRNLFSFRSFLATLIGLSVVAVWAFILIAIGWIANPWAGFFAAKNALGWIPLGAVLLAWLASTIARQILRVR